MPSDFSGLFDSMQTYNPVLDRLRDDIRKGALPDVKIEHPAKKTNELLEEQNHKIDELQTALVTANIQIATLHDTIKENEAAYQQEQRRASVAAKRTNRISIAIAIVSIIVSILIAISPSASQHTDDRGAISNNPTVQDTPSPSE